MAREVTITSPAPVGEWRRLLAGAEAPLITQTPEWMASITGAGRWRDRSRLYELGDGRKLLVPLVGLGAGPAAILRSWPAGWGYGGALTSGGGLQESDVGVVTRDLAGIPGLRTSLIASPYEPVWQAATPAASSTVDYLTHVLDLSGGRAQVWKGFSDNVKRSVRRAERSGLDIRRDHTGELLGHFTHLHRKSMDRWARTAGRPVGMARMQQRLLEVTDRLPRISQVFGPACTVWAAFARGEPAAAIVVLADRAHALYWRGAMDRDLAGPTHANALLHHRAIEEAISAGARSYCFGESDPGSALAAYKAKFGARPVTWSTYHWERMPITGAIAAARAGYRKAGPLISRWVGRP